MVPELSVAVLDEMFPSPPPPPQALRIIDKDRNERSWREPLSNESTFFFIDLIVHFINKKSYKFFRY